MVLFPTLSFPVCRCVCVMHAQVAIVTPDLSAFQTEDGELIQEQEQQVVSPPHPVTLLATSNGTHIAVQVQPLSALSTITNENGDID